MEKLILPEFTYREIPGIKKAKEQRSPDYDRLQEEATKRIRKRHLEYARAYREAEYYFYK